MFNICKVLIIICAQNVPSFCQIKMNNLRKYTHVLSDVKLRAPPPHPRTVVTFPSKGTTAHTVRVSIVVQNFQEGYVEAHTMLPITQNLRLMVRSVSRPLHAREWLRALPSAATSREQISPHQAWDLSSKRAAQPTHCFQTLTYTETSCFNTNSKHLLLLK